MFESILIANRGEIACRIIRTCKRLGVASVAVYADADRRASFVEQADVAYALGASEPRHSYLNGARILEIAKMAGAAAVHPGYGFLAENAEFAELCARSGITFIGPPPAAIRAMGLKHEAKLRMERAGVRVLPGYLGEEQSDERLSRAASEVGYPLLIKAVAGGGGKGMRRVDRPEELARMLEAARREARAAFGDERVLLEKYLERPRHIEVQVFGDRHGQVVHLFSRDCSTQRRHQKVIEEAPPPGLTDAFEETIHELAVRAARAIQYEGAGTVELIADVAEGLSAERVYFMEMNTRLQVEHPVTELITGLDLVEWQLRVAAGEPLPLSQAQIGQTGHAIEARLYAEDPARDYMPQSGRLVHFSAPRDVRVDSGFRSGDEVSVYYDALLAKLVVWGVDRRTAVQRLHAALGECEVAGLVTNLPLLAAIARHPAFVAGDVHTGFIEQHRSALFARDEVSDELLWVLACVGKLEARAERAAHDASPWSDTRAFRINQPHGDELVFLHEGERVPVPVTFTGGGLELALPRRAVSVRHARLDGVHVCCEYDGRRVRGLYVEEAERTFTLAQGRYLELRSESGASAADEESATGTLAAPMPGRIHAVLVGVGEQITRGQPLLSLEAMKMEHTLRAPHAGKVAVLHARVGEQVEEGRPLLVLEASEEA